MKLSEKFTKLSNINKSRGNDYGDFRKLGKVLSSYFPDPLTIEGEDEWNRLALLMLTINKVVRYSVNFKKGGHSDSLNDVAVYAMMLQGMDEEKK